ncbi:MAG: type IV secretion system DNA-binding domain-containing protein [Chitinispirillales bacterium]|jgi:type IV secretory pathway TraG/TraD family ATPase VirD4|nr:type IV secretion system DNA-binding domain-containing protein [Chitinispirillales bacterium]
MALQNTNVKVCEGLELLDRVPQEAQSSGGGLRVDFTGKNALGQPDKFSLSEKLLSQHLLLLGGIGSGKTNTFNQIMQSLIPQMSNRDIMVIFDTKGDFYKEFYRPGDIVISNDTTACGTNGVDYWNLLNEIEDDGRIDENVIEIANTLFADKLKNAKDSFFPNAAKDIVSAILYHFAKIKNRRQVDNSTFSIFFKTATANEDIKSKIVGVLEMYTNFSAMKSYIPDQAKGQSEGVIAEIQQVIRQVFVGNFAKQGTLSLRQLIRAKGGKRIFIEYDIGIGSMLAPIYTLMFDLAIKEALSRAKSDGNVFFIVDEFKLLPNLKHIDDAVNFGRSLGIKFMIGIQNTDQIIEAYNEHMAMNIFSGFLNHFCFKVNDFSTRKYIKERGGENRKCTTFKSTTVQESIAVANIIEDWDIANLKLGEAVVMLNNASPFKFGFSEFKGK